MRPYVDQVRELLGAANLNSTADRKAANKVAKANYAAELQAQMRANEEAKQRERMERRGLAVPPGLQPPQPQFGLGGAASPGAIGAGFGGVGFGGAGIGYGAQPPPFGANPGFPPPGAPPGPSAFGPPSPGQGGPQPPWVQSPLFPPGPFQPPGAGAPPGGAFGPARSNSPPPMYGGHGAGGPFGSPGRSNSPPPMYGGAGANGFGALGFGPQPGYGGGYGAPPPPPPAPPPLLPGPAPPPGPGRETLQRMAQQAKRDQYRQELEAQIRDREERRVADKARQREEDARKEAEMAAYAARGGLGGGRGGGGAPHRDAAGNIVANFGQINRMGAPGGGPGFPMGPGGPGGMGPPGPGFGGPGGMGMGMGGPPSPGAGMGGMGGGFGMGAQGPPPLVGSPSGMGGGFGMGGPPGFGAPPAPPVVGSPPGMGGGMGMGPAPGMGGPAGGFGGPPGFGAGPGMGGGPGMDGPPGVLPSFRFRSDNPYLTPGELDNKQRQAKQLQQELQQQIEEKRRAKEMEKQKEIEEIAREEARFRNDAQPAAPRGGAGAPRDRGEVVADAWEKARLEAEEAKRSKFAAKRGAAAGSGGGGAPSPGPGPAGVAWPDGPFGGGAAGAAAADFAMQPPLPGVQPLGQSPLQPLNSMGSAEVYPPPPPPPMMGVGRPTTPLVAEKVRQVAAAELAAVKQELVAEAAQLREVVAAQGQQVAALKSHAERLEAEAERARNQATAVRVGLIRQSAEEPEGFLHVMADYDRPLAAMAPAAAAAAPPPPPLMDIALDLPPPAAALRRAAAAAPMVYDLGAAIPPMNSAALMMGNAAASSINAAGVAARGDAAANGRPPTMGLRTINPLEASMAAESVFIYPNGREMARYANAVARGATQQSEAGAAAVAGGPPAVGPVPPPGATPFESLQMSGGAVLASSNQQLETGPVPRTPPGLGLAAERSSRGGVGLEAAAEEAGIRLDEEDGQASGRREEPEAIPVDVDLVLNRNQDKLAALKNMTELAGGATSIEALDDFLARYAAQRTGLPERTASPVLRIITPEAGGTTTTDAAAADSAAIRSMASESKARAARAGASEGETVIVAEADMTVDEAVVEYEEVTVTGAGTRSAQVAESGDWAEPRQSAPQRPLYREPEPRSATTRESQPPRLYSSRANSVGPLPMGGGRVLSASPTLEGAGCRAGGASGRVSGGGAAAEGVRRGSGGGSSANGRPSSQQDTAGSGTVVLARRNSFTGERSPQEGALSQLYVPLHIGSRPGSSATPSGSPMAAGAQRAGAGSSAYAGSPLAGGVRAASPMASRSSSFRAQSPAGGRPPALPNNRYSGTGGASANGRGASAGLSSGNTAVSTTLVDGFEEEDGEDVEEEARVSGGNVITAGRMRGSEDVGASWMNPPSPGGLSAISSVTGSHLSAIQMYEGPSSPTASVGASSRAGSAVYATGPGQVSYPGSTLTSNADYSQLPNVMIAASAGPSPMPNWGVTASRTESPTLPPNWIGGAAGPSPSPRPPSTLAAGASPSLRSAVNAASAIGAVPPPRPTSSVAVAAASPSPRPPLGAAASLTSAASGSATAGKLAAARKTYADSEDGSLTPASSFPSYNPSREQSQQGPRPLSRSRSLSTAHATGYANGGGRIPAGVEAQPAQPPEDTLDQEMRRGLGSRPPTGQSGMGSGRPGSQAGLGGAAAGVSLSSYGISRAPLPTGSGRLSRGGSANGQRSPAGFGAYASLQTKPA